jgi:serine/threonine-protein kinase
LLVGALATALVVAQARATRLEEETLTANVYAARGVASTVLWKLDRLSQPVLKAASDPALAELLTHHERATDGEERSRWRTRLQAFLSTIPLDADEETARPEYGRAFQTWHLLDGQGVLVADSVQNPRVVGMDFRERDYFQGAVARAGAVGPATVHISRVYQSRNDGLHKFAIAVAIVERAETRKVLGVIAATLTTTATLGSLRLDDDRRTAVLVGRQDSSPRSDAAEYVVILHPAYARGDWALPLSGERLQRLHSSQPGRPELVLPEVAPTSDRMLATDANYADPVAAWDPRYGGRWLAGFAPVGNTELVVIVQQRYTQAVEPELTLAWNATFWSGVALAVAALLVGTGLRWWLLQTRQRGPRATNFALKE